MENQIFQDAGAEELAQEQVRKQEQAFIRFDEPTEEETTLFSLWGKFFCITSLICFISAITSLILMVMLKNDNPYTFYETHLIDFIFLLTKRLIFPFAVLGLLCFVAHQLKIKK